MIHLPGIKLSNTISGAGVTSRASVRLATTGPVVFEDIIVGYVIDGITIAANDRLLVKNQSALSEITEITTVADSGGSLGGTWFSLNSVEAEYYVWFNVGGSSDPAPSGLTAIEVGISTNDSAPVVADKLQTALNPNIEFSVGFVGSTVTVTNATAGPVEDAQDTDTGFTFNITQYGTGSIDNGIWEIQPSGEPIRTADFDVDDSVGGSKFVVREGSTQGDTMWLCINDPPDDMVGTDTLVFEQTGAGNVTGPISSNDNEIVRWDSTTNKIIQGSSVTLDDTGNFVGVNDITFETGTFDLVLSTTDQSVSAPTVTIPDLAGTSGDILINNATQTITNKTITATSNNVTANGLRSATTTVSVSAATAPTVGQVLKATSGTTATWQADTAGESNTSSSAGGTSLVLTKVGVDLPFKGLTATSSKVSLAANANDVGIDVAEGNLTLDNIGGTLSVSKGGTSAVTHGSGNVLVGAGTGAITSTKAAPSGDFVGTTDTQTLTNKTAVDTSNNITARGIHSATTTIGLAAATAPTTGQLLTALSETAATWQDPEMVGPGSSTDNAIVRWDSTSGKLIQDSAVVVGDTGNFTGVGTLGFETGTYDTTLSVSTQTVGAPTITIPDLAGTSGDILINNATQTITNKTITDSTNNVTANGLRSATTTVSVSSATAPTMGQVLQATSSSDATWQNSIQNILTTKGDILGFSTLPVRAPIGDDGFIAIADSTNALGWKWGSPSDTSSGVTTTILWDEKTTGTNGGTFTDSTWVTRVINTLTDTNGGDETTPSVGGISLSSNQFTLQAGTYFTLTTGTAYRVNEHKARMYNVTDSSVMLYGTSQYAKDSAQGSASTSVIFGNFSIASAKTLELQQYCSDTYVSSGFGQASGISGTPEIYSFIIFHKIA